PRPGAAVDAGVGEPGATGPDARAELLSRGRPGPQRHSPNWTGSGPDRLETGPTKYRPVPGRASRRPAPRGGAVGVPPDDLCQNSWADGPAARGARWSPGFSRRRRHRPKPGPHLQGPDMPNYFPKDHQ